MLNSFCPKRVHPERNHKHSGPERCVEDDCGKATRNGKRYCIAHIHLTPYAQSLNAEMIRRKDEVQQLDDGQILDKSAHLVSEARAVLWEKRNVTAPGLTRVMDLTHEQARRLFRSVAEHGIAEIYRNRRGVITAKALGDQDITLS